MEADQDEQHGRERRYPDGKEGGRPWAGKERLLLAARRCPARSSRTWCTPSAQGKARRSA